MTQTDFNPILDYEAQTCAAVMVSDTRLADLIEITFELEPASGQYCRGWGSNCLDTTLILSGCCMIINDKIRRLKTFKMDVCAGQAPVIIELDAKQYFDNINSNRENTLRML